MHAQPRARRPRRPRARHRHRGAAVGARHAHPHAARPHAGHRRTAHRRDRVRPEGEGPAAHRARRPAQPAGRVVPRAAHQPAVPRHGRAQQLRHHLERSERGQVDHDDQPRDRPGRRRQARRAARRRPAQAQGRRVPRHRGRRRPHRRAHRPRAGGRRHAAVGSAHAVRAARRQDSAQPERAARLDADGTRCSRCSSATSTSCCATLRRCFR